MFNLLILYHNFPVILTDKINILDKQPTYIIEINIDTINTKNVKSFKIFTCEEYLNIYKSYHYIIDRRLSVTLHKCFNDVYKMSDNNKMININIIKNTFYVKVLIEEYKCIFDIVERFHYMSIATKQNTNIYNYKFITKCYKCNNNLVSNKKKLYYYNKFNENKLCYLCFIDLMKIDNVNIKSIKNYKLIHHINDFVPSFNSFNYKVYRSCNNIKFYYDDNIKHYCIILNSLTADRDNYVIIINIIDNIQILYHNINNINIMVIDYNIENLKLLWCDVFTYENDFFNLNSVKFIKC